MKDKEIKRRYKFFQKEVDSSGLAYLLVWGNLSEKEKEELSFAQCRQMMSYIYSDSPEEAEAWELTKKKAETLKELKSILYVCKDESSEILERIRVKAKEITS